MKKSTALPLCADPLDAGLLSEVLLEALILLEALTLTRPTEDSE